MNGRRLSRIHERVAAALEEHLPNNVAEIALHYDRAGNKAKTYQFAVSAGAGAVSVYAHTEARTFFGLAARSAENEEQKADAVFRLAEVAETEGNYAHGGASLRGSVAGAWSARACSRSTCRSAACASACA